MFFRTRKLPNAYQTSSKTSFLSLLWNNYRFFLNRSSCLLKGCLDSILSLAEMFISFPIFTHHFASVQLFPSFSRCCDNAFERRLYWSYRLLRFPPLDELVFRKCLIWLFEYGLSLCYFYFIFLFQIFIIITLLSCMCIVPIPMLILTYLVSVR